MTRTEIQRAVIYTRQSKDAESNGQAIARQSFLASADAPTLFALGTTRTQLFVLGLLRAAVVAVVAAPVAPRPSGGAFTPQAARKHGP